MFIYKYKNSFIKINKFNICSFSHNNGISNNTTNRINYSTLSTADSKINNSSLLNIQQITHQYKSLIDKLNNNKLNNSNSGSLDQILNVQRSILEYGVQEINKLSYSERLDLIVSFWKLNKFKVDQESDNQLSQDNYNDIWELMNTSCKEFIESSSFLDFIKIQFELSAYCTGFRAKLKSSLQDLVTELKKKKENQQNGILVDYSSLVEFAFKFSLKMGLWREAIQIREGLLDQVKWLDKVNENGRDRDLNNEFENHDYELIYRIVSRHPKVSSLCDPIIDSGERQHPLGLNQDLEYTGSYIIQYQVTHSDSSATLFDSNDRQVLTPDSQLPLPHLNFLNVGEEYNYYLNPIKLLIDGRLIKLIYDHYSKSKVIYCGIINQDFTKCQLVGLEDSDDGTPVNFGLNLSISKNENSIQLEGDNIIVSKFQNGEYLIQKYHNVNFSFKKDL